MSQVQITQPLNKPLMPPIFLTIWANFVYCVSNSCTSLVATPDPRATRWMRLACLVKSLAPSLLSSSEMINHNVLTKPVQFRTIHLTIQRNQCIIPLLDRTKRRGGKHIPWSFILSIIVMSFFSLVIDSCSFPLLMKSVPKPGIIP